MSNQDLKKLAFFLPNMFTALNMACGFMGMMFSLSGDFYKACIIIAVGAIFDSVDGRVARLTGTQSAFGEQFDSLSDLISFGMAPAFIFYNRFLISWGRIGLVVSFLFLLCGALRLARFNANIDKVSSNYFQGLPIPSGASAVIGYILISIKFPALLEWSYFHIIYLVFYSLLMISNIPFPSFKKSQWVKNHKKQTLMLLFIVLCSIFIDEEVMILFWLTLYVISSLFYYLTHRSHMDSIIEWKNEADNSEDH